MITLRLRALVGTVLLGVTTPLGLSAQATEDDHATVLMLAIEDWAEFRGVPLREVALRLDGIGLQVLPASPGATPADQFRRVVPTGRLRSEAARRGFQVAGGGDFWRAGELPPGIPFQADTVGKVIWGTPRIHGDSAVVHLTASLLLRQERQEWSDLMKFVFARRDGVWLLTEAKWETGEVVEW